MAERRKSLHSEQMAPKNIKRRRTMMDSISDVAKWILPSWASEGVTDNGRLQDIQEPGSSGLIMNGESSAKRPRYPDISRREAIGRLSPVGAAVSSTATLAAPEPDFDDGSDSSTSGCSSLSAAPIPGTTADKRSDDKFLQQRRQRPIQNTREAKTREVSTTVDQTSLVAESSMSASQSINFSLYSRPSRGLSSTLNTTFPVVNTEARSLSSSLHKPERSLNRSIFYEGKTTYGGAAAHRKLNLFSSSPYQMAPRRQKVATNVSVPESSHAKRLIEVLERMKTPVQNAKKIPLSRQDFGNTSLSSEARRKEAMETIASLRQNPPPSLSTCKRSVAPARIGSNVKPSDFSIDLDESVNQAAVPNFSVITSTPRVNAISANHDHHSERSSAGGKMKSSKNLHHQSQRKVIPEEEPLMSSAPDLPSSATLPIKELPKFSFAPSKSQSSAFSTQEAPKSSISAMTTTRSPLTSLADFSNKPFEKHVPIPVCNSNSNEMFTFAEPVSLDKPNKEILSGCKEEFCFKDPLYLNRDSLTKSSFTMVAPTIFLDSPNLKLKEITKQSPPTVAEFMTGSVMDVLGPGREQNQTKPIIKQWECSKCSILNKSEDNSCIVCETKKNDANQPTQMTNSSSVGFGNLFKKEAGSWTCETCMVQNKPDVTKCVACETPCATAKNVSKPIDPPVSNSLSEMFKKPEGSWSCQVCMVSNDAAKTKCVACETSKPGAQPAKSSTSSFKLKMEPGWNCNTCLVRNNLSATKCVACEEPKEGTTQPAAPAKPVVSSFKFGVPASSGSEVEKPKENAATIFGADNPTKTTTTPMNGFKFGVTDDKVATKEDAPKTPFASQINVSNNSTATMSFGVPSSTVATSQSGKVTSGFGGFTFGDPTSLTKAKSEPEKTNATVSGASFSFGAPIPLSTAPATDSVKTTPFSFGAPPKDASPAAQVFGFGAPSTSNSQVGASSTPKSTFSFAPVSSAPAGTSSNVFASSASSPTNAFGSNTTVTTSASSMPIVSSGFSVSSSAAPSSTTAEQSKTPAAPLFKFGAAAPKPAAEAPTATPAPFVFGNLNSTPSTGFNFGAVAAQPATTAAPSFTFGAASAGTPKAFGSSAPGGASAPSGASAFGTPVPGTTNPFGGATPAPAPATPAAPVFGAATATTTPAPALPAFGSSTTSTPAFGAAPATGVLFQFGAAAAAATPQTTSVPAAASSTFSFQPSTPATGGLFAFGAPSTSTPAPTNVVPPPAAATPFQFGNNAAPAAATSPTTDMFSFGNPASTAVPPVNNFQFGMPAPGAATGPFAFGGGAPASAPAANAFTADNPFNAPGGRKMRRALRRKTPR